MSRILFWAAPKQSWMTESSASFSLFVKDLAPALIAGIASAPSLNGASFAIVTPGMALDHLCRACMFPAAPPYFSDHSDGNKRG